jgi:hypothetical protein
MPLANQEFEKIFSKDPFSNERFNKGYFKVPLANKQAQGLVIRAQAPILALIFKAAKPAPGLWPQYFGPKV